MYKQIVIPTFDKKRKKHYLWSYYLEKHKGLRPQKFIIDVASSTHNNDFIVTNPYINPYSNGNLYVTLPYKVEILISGSFIWVYKYNKT